MCLLVLAWRAHPRWRLIVAANRDEYHARAAWPAAVYADRPQILAGRDAQAGGTWLGVSRDRRLGVVTNFRERARPRRSAPSRGRLIPEFLAPESSSRAPAAWLAAELATESVGYAGFNLLLAERESLAYASNRLDGEFVRELPPGIHGLSNHRLDTPWPKLVRTRARFAAWLEADAAAQNTQDPTAPLLAMLEDRDRVARTELVDTGPGMDWEHVLSAPFVRHPEYGTRCSSIVLIGYDDSLVFVERRFDARGEKSGESHYDLGPQEWPEDEPPPQREPPEDPEPPQRDPPKRDDAPQREPPARPQTRTR